MWEYGIKNVQTNEESVIYGLSPEDAFNRYPQYNPLEWYIWYSEYND